MSAFAGRAVLVTGGTGFIGSWLVARLLDLEARVTVLVLDHDPSSELIRSGRIRACRVVDGRLEEIGDLERALLASEADIVFHLAAQALVLPALEAPLLTFEANIRGTYNLLEACRRHPKGLSAVVVASSDKAYGDAPVLPYTEEMPVAGRHPYDVSKSCADLLARAYAHTYGLPVTVARCGNVYGGGDLAWSRIVPGTIRSVLRGERPVIRSDGRFTRDYLHVDDVVDAYLALAAATGGAGAAGRRLQLRPRRPGERARDRRPPPRDPRPRGPRARRPRHGQGRDPRPGPRLGPGAAPPRVGAADRPSRGARADGGLVPGIPRGGVSGDELRARILALVGEYAAAEWPAREFVPGDTPVPVSGRVFDGGRRPRARRRLARLLADGGPRADDFEKGLARGDRRALGAPRQLRLLGEPPRRHRPHGPRARRAPARARATRSSPAPPGFPTTVAPIVQNGARAGLPRRRAPDVQRRPRRASRRRRRPRTKAIVLAHTLGNPFDLDRVASWARETRPLSSSRTAATRSAPPGGAAPSGASATSRRSASTPRTTSRRARGAPSSLPTRPSGRSSSRSATGAATAGASRARRTPAVGDSTGQLGELPPGYDHKYVYSRLGYNLKATDLQAAIGVAQLRKLPRFVEARRRNFDHLRRAPLAPEGAPRPARGDARERPELVRLPAHAPRGRARSTAGS